MFCLNEKQLTQNCCAPCKIGFFLEARQSLTGIMDIYGLKLYRIIGEKDFLQGDLSLSEFALGSLFSFIYYIYLQKMFSNDKM